MPPISDEIPLGWMMLEAKFEHKRDIDQITSIGQTSKIWQKV